MKKFAQKNCRKMFLEAISFAFEKTFFRVFVTALHDIIGLQNFSLSFCQSLSRITMCDLHWCYTFCTAVTLFALVLHFNCTALSQSESSNVFMCIISLLIIQLKTFLDSVWLKRSAILLAIETFTRAYLF